MSHMQRARRFFLSYLRRLASVAAMTDTGQQKFDAVTLSAENLACTRGGRRVFAGLSFSLENGGLLYLRGPNGMGKSTLLRLIAGLTPAREGTLRFGGDIWRGSRAAEAEAVIYAGHENALKPVLTLREHAENYVKLMTGASLSDDALKDAAAVFDLTRLLDQPARFFSSGQKHRASLMRFALVARPLWLMDEPTVGLDSANRQALEGLMARHLAAGGLIIAATHDPIALEGAELNLKDYQPKIIIDEAWV